MRRGLAAGVAATALIASCNVGELIDDASRSEPRTRADVQLVMEPGEGRGALAESLAAGVGGPGRLVPGSADHLDFVTLEEGRMDIVRFQTRDPDIGLMDCVSEIGEGQSGTTCGGPPGSSTGVMGTSEGPDLNTATALAPPGTIELRITTSLGAIVSVIPANGAAYAAWPADLGEPTRFEFLDAAGRVIERAGS